MGGVVLRVDDDLAGLAPLAGDGADARCRAQAVHIGVLVAHDVDLLGLVHQLAQGIGHDPGLDLGALFGALAAAAVKLEVGAVLHHGLVAAAAEGHLQGQGGVLEQLLEAVLVTAHADGQRGGHTLAGLDLTHLFQHGELALHKAGVVLLLEEEEVAVAVVAQQQSAGVRRPAVELLLQGGLQGGALVLRAGLGQLVIIVDHEDGHERLCQLQGLAHLLLLRDIHPVGGGQGGLLHGVVLRAAQRAEHAVDAVVPAEQVGVLLLPLQQPAVAEIGDDAVHRRLEDSVLLGGQGQEHVVAPQDLAGVHVKDQHGQGRVEHIAGAGGIHAAGDPVHVLAHGGLGHLRAAAAHHDHQDGHDALRHRQQRLEGDGDGHEGHQAQAVKGHIGAEAADDLFAQKAFLLSMTGYR